MNGQQQTETALSQTRMVIATHAPLLTAICDQCGWPFATVRPSARFCSGRCRGGWWKRRWKLDALVDWLMDAHQLDESVRPFLSACVEHHEGAFAAFLRWRGVAYHTKKHLWRTVETKRGMRRT